MSDPAIAPEPGTVPDGSRVPEGSGVPKVPDLAAMVRSMAAVEPPVKRGHGNGLTDEALEAQARTLADRLGRLPTGAELIEAAGGCRHSVDGEAGVDQSRLNVRCLGSDVQSRGRQRHGDIRGSRQSVLPDLGYPRSSLEARAPGKPVQRHI